MATAASTPYRITAEQFLAIKWDSSDVKAELDNGVIKMMAGGSIAHSRIQGNVLAALRTKLRGSGCRPHGSDMGLKTADESLRYPDVSVSCGQDDPHSDLAQSLDDPKVVVEVLSPSTRASDLTVKLAEYRNMPSLNHIIYIDPETEAIRCLARVGPRGWNDVDLEKGQDVNLASLAITLSWSEIFDRT